MTDPLDQPGAALALARDIAAKLEKQLDSGAHVIALSREDAVVAFGLVNAIVDDLARSATSRH